MKKITLLLYFLIFSFINAQQFKFIKKISGFEDAASISINNDGKIFISDISKNEIFKFDTSGRQIAYIGGYGWDVDQFDSPVKIFATTLNIYVADKNNNRILFYDKDLNYISELNSESIENPDYKFYYPTACAVSNQGDFFILDSDNSRILKFDLNGNFLFEIGNQNSGEFSLSNPVGLAISNNGRLFTSDGEEIIVFNLFGRGLFKFRTGFKVTNLNFNSGVLTVSSSRKVKLYKIGKTIEYLREFNPGLKSPIKIKDAQLFKNKFYLLTNHFLLIYSVN